ncbi:hypothetical protein JHJ32_11030 [Parapedobacter sp. ISTM3]|uniref:Uncharacterized protein n=1 Tax=Parapedobacter luteus TaxID=623280 RepID=A0A1T5D302_9SPHI|nr:MULTISPECIES: hypothetical protein [Parapedobacter]MBK1440521.1 hypothetical protein [Parapedobacter sp. ISTM3]SKB65880.1 hypothetical protein SAMN05660226_02573 [Parapedobacter luteus]
MKTIILLIFLCLTSFSPVQGQTKILSFSASKANGSSWSDLDKRYKNALDADSALAVFKTAEEQANLIEAYQGFLVAISNHLSEQGVKWKGTTRIFNRFYFDRNGNVEYYSYTFLSNPPNEADERQFVDAMSSFFKAHRFGVTADVPFAQCSPVTFQ